VDMDNSEKGKQKSNKGATINIKQEAPEILDTKRAVMKRKRNEIEG